MAETDFETEGFSHKYGEHHCESWAYFEPWVDIALSHRNVEKHIFVPVVSRYRDPQLQVMKFIYILTL